MSLSNILKTTAFCAAFGLGSTTLTAAPTSILFILDASGSMAGKVDGVPKMVTAKQSLAKLLADLPTDTKVGLMIYGHREKKSCTDVEVALPLGTANPQRLSAVLQGIVPNGKTPIAFSLERSSSVFAGLAKENNNVVLISDGIETCAGDPCKAAGALAKAKVNVRVHVVGFDISEKDRQQLECIARVGKGKYFAANSTHGFATAVKAAVNIAQADTPKPTPPPPAPKPQVYFFDDFKSEVLAEHWEVLNPDTEGYVVEEGFLTILTSKTMTLLDRNDKMQNMFRLGKTLPRGNWRITMRIKPGISTFRESYSLALYTDKDKYLALTAHAAVQSWKGHIYMGIEVNKFSRGTNTKYEKALIKSKKSFGHRTLPNDSKPYYAWTNENIKAIRLRIRKKGRSYFASAMVEGKATMGGDKKPQWVDLEKLTSLRSPGKNVLFAIGQRKLPNRYDAIPGGETLAQVDWVKIETLE